MGELVFTCEGLATTITTIICATAVIVAFIAVAVFFVVWFCAVTFAIFQRQRIQALAFLAVRELIFILTLPAAVSIVPTAATVIVFIVATSIAQVRGGATFSILRTLFLFLGIFALACFAISILVLVTTTSAAVTIVPVTSTVVISIVAAFVTLEARAFAFAAALFLCICRIQTFASLTIRELP